MKRNKRIWSWALAGAMAVSNLSLVVSPLTAMAAPVLYAGNAAVGDKISFAAGSSGGTLEDEYKGSKALTADALEVELPAGDGTVFVANSTKQVPGGFHFVWSIGSKNYEVGVAHYGDLLVGDDGKATLTGNFVGNDLTVTFDDGEITADVPGQIHKIYKTNLTTAIPNPTKLGYTFTGWDIDRQEGADITPSMTASQQSAVIDNYYLDTDFQTSSITATALWKEETYTVKYNANGKTAGAFELTDQSVKGSELAGTQLAEIPTTIEKTGYTAGDKWHTKADGSDDGYSAATTVEALFTAEGGTTVTLYYPWEEATSYTATLHGYSTLAIEWTGGSKTVKKSNATVTLPTVVKTVNPTKNQIALSSSNTFLGWDNKTPAKDVVYSDGATITLTSDINLYPVHEIPESTYDITFNKGDGKGTMSKVAVTTGSTFTIPESTFTAPEKKSFLNWTSDGKTYAPGDVITVNDGLTLTAQYQFNNAIVFHNGTKTVKRYVDYESDAALADPFDPAVADLVGWGTSSSAKNPDYQLSAIVADVFTAEGQTVDLYAVTNSAPLTVKYIVGRTDEAEKDGTAGVAKNATFKIGKNFTKAPTTPAGFELAGFTKRYYTNEAAAKAANAKIYAVGDSYAAEEEAITFYCLWRAEPQVLTLNANGGTGTAITVKTYTDTIDKLPKNTYTKSGNVFKGWALTETGAVKYEDEAANVPYTATLYAVWAPNTYIFEYDKNGSNVTGNGFNDVVVSDDTDLHVSATTANLKGINGENPEWVNPLATAMAGWALDPKATEAEFVATNTYADVIKKADPSDGDTVTLYAVWTYSEDVQEILDSEEAAKQAEAEAKDEADAAKADAATSKAAADKANADAATSKAEAEAAKAELAKVPVVLNNAEAKTGEKANTKADGTAEITSIPASAVPSNGNYTVPSSIEIEGKTYTVTKVADNALKNCKAKSITFPETITEIGKKACFKAKAKKIQIMGKDVIIRGKAFGKLNKKAKIFVKDKDTKANVQARGGQPKSVTIKVKKNMK